ncbi:MAG: hypothetical protein QGG73_07235 [Candidatus Hydrogenedentes bacterium]|jgi:hypothetical protein|nr:hypothetical protein [Candidatus Hydrogenedentota bacterium]
METEDVRAGRRFKDPWHVVIVQLLIPVGFTAYILAVVAWIAHLIFTSRKLEDVPSASTAISIAAIPVFLVILGVFLYVSYGVLFNQCEKRAERVEE